VLFHKPPYSPDLAPSELWLFAALKKHVKGIQSTCDEGVQAARVKWLQGQPEEFYTDWSEKLVHRWRHRIKLEAHYMENEL
jgi:transposase